MDAVLSFTERLAQLFAFWTETFHTLGGVELLIPAHQLALFASVVSLCLLFRKFRFGLMCTYLFVLYWGYVIYWGRFVDVTAGSPGVLAVYICSGLALAFLAVLSFFS